MKPIVTCLMCLEAVPKAVYFFHLMKFHAKAPCLDEAPALFADFLPPGCDVDADDSEVEEEEVLGEQEKEDEADIHMNLGLMKAQMAQASQAMCKKKTIQIVRLNLGLMKAQTGPARSPTTTDIVALN
mmetsp:Transcript_12736/g.36381  ORF Transcript_12736/g.36381 Transcript_12736/m.36381 type:complete len:128 (+) Transcript_12736:577-960(+)